MGIREGHWSAWGRSAGSEDSDPTPASRDSSPLPTYKFLGLVLVMSLQERSNRASGANIRSDVAGRSGGANWSAPASQMRRQVKAGTQRIRESLH